MRFEIILAPEAIRALKALPGHIRAAVRDGIEVHLRFEPEKKSRSRIKRLQGLDRPQYRLRIEETRVFYDVSGTTVQVLDIVDKKQAQAWLKEKGIASPP